MTEAAIIDFALRFDPQPFHVDAVAAASPYGGIIASGLPIAGSSIGWTIPNPGR
jgi:acyl dehydratase